MLFGPFLIYYLLLKTNYPKALALQHPFLNYYQFQKPGISLLILSIQQIQHSSFRSFKKPILCAKFTSYFLWYYAL